jgi:predicted nucleic acid-binding protein
MIYLLDVNAVLALHYDQHVHFARVRNWYAARGQQLGPRHFVLATCAITELGFVRIAGGKAGLARNVPRARLDLQNLKIKENLQFLCDDVPIESLSAWVRKPEHTTDGHLLKVAEAHRALLATLDTRIPGAELIVDVPESPWVVREPSMRYGSAA